MIHLYPEYNYILRISKRNEKKKIFHNNFQKFRQSHWIEKSFSDLKKKKPATFRELQNGQGQDRTDHTGLFRDEIFPSSVVLLLRRKPPFYGVLHSLWKNNKHQFMRQ